MVNTEANRLLGVLLDAIVNGHAVSMDDWEEACLLGGRSNKQWVARKDALDRLRTVAEEFCNEVDRALAEKERPPGGQRVPFHGDFASTNPSTLNQLRRWARELRFAMTSPNGRKG